jgi:hypothetical protein
MDSERLENKLKIDEKAELTYRPLLHIPVLHGT